MKLYLDTSTYGGYYDPEFELWTIPLITEISEGHHTVIYSGVVAQELIGAPDKVTNLVRSLPADLITFVEVSDEVQALAELYIQEKVVGMTSYFDCLHIALATIHNADVLVSWNFKHIVNVTRIRGYNAVNLEKGYQSLDIRSPRELLDYGEE